MSETGIGRGTLEWFSYWVKAYDEKEGLVWEGVVDGRPDTRSDGLKMLKVQNNTIPRELHEAFQKYGTLRTEFEPAWEDAPILQQIVPENTISDEDNQA